MSLAQLSDVEAWLGLQPGNADEALLSRLITAASTFVETWCSRNFAITEFKDYRDGNGKTFMTMQQAPVIAVNTLTISGMTIPATQPAAGNGYFLASKRLYLIGYQFTRGYANVIVDYTAGFATIPTDISQAVIELVAMRYRERDRIGTSSVHAAGETTAYSLKDMPAQVATILGQYKRVVPQ